MTKVWYDCEFLDDGTQIQPISIGLIAEDGRELYRVLLDVDYGNELHEKIRTHRWLMENVVPHLPLSKSVSQSSANNFTWYFDLDTSSLLVVCRRQLRNEVRAFLDATPDAELWAWYGAYDHVMLAQLFGLMLDKPPSMPMWTNDLKQLQVARGVSDEQLEAAVPNEQAHNALADARWTRDAYRYLTSTSEGE